MCGVRRGASVARPAAAVGRRASRATDACDVTRRHDGGGGQAEASAAAQAGLAGAARALGGPAPAGSGAAPRPTDRSLARLGRFQPVRGAGRA